jgi:HNH endonuclease
MGAPRTIPDRACAVCETHFRPRYRPQMCCSQACGHIFKRTRVPQPCAYCSTPFMKAETTQRFCSHACASQFKTAKRVAVCERCGIDFIRPHGKQRRYCSVSCAAKSRPIGDGRGLALELGTLRSHPSGYVKEKTADGWVMQHRLVMSRTLCRPLEKHERVHHRNGVRSDNAPDNLELWTTKHKDPPGARVVDVVIGALLKQPAVKALGAEAAAAIRAAAARMR